jgi:2-(1,2-epoxy-1,2-dihydrophenyl)acetyl-CoA isomerase
MSDLMRLEVADGVGVLRFALPERRNPYSLGFVDALCATLAGASSDVGVRAIVMTGGGHFCSGGDLVEFRQKVSEGARATQELLDAANRGVRAAYGFDKPLISAVNGVCYGAGMSLAISADLVVAAEDARFCEVFARLGGCPDTGSSWLLQQRIGAGAARMLTYTGREISGRTAHEMGLVDDCVAAEKTEETAIALATEIAANPLFGLMSNKRVMREVVDCSFDQALQVEARAQSLLLCGDDFREAMAAFAEKRKPRFRDS